MAVLFKYCFVVKINRIIPLFAVVARLLKRNDITTILIAASSAQDPGLPEYDIITDCYYIVCYNVIVM